MAKLFFNLVFVLMILGASQGKDFGEVMEPYLREASSFTAEGSQERYDYIIVGGGTAGCPLAATLSHNYSVLLLERGGSPYGNLNVSYMQNFHINLADTSPTSASQPFISTDGVINSRARVLGGGTCINAGFYTRASTSYVKSAGWNDQLVNESYPWIEERLVHKPKLAEWQVALKDGLLQAGISPFNGYTYDHLYGTKVGGTIFDERGFRSTAADLLPSGNTQNLNIMLHATVQKIIFDQARGRRPRAVGVLFKDENGGQHEAYLNAGGRSEIIMSSGTLGSPQLLMLSGIGPKNDLIRLNIPVVLHNKHVGKGLSDNPMNAVFIPTKRPVEQSLIQTVGITKIGTFIEATSGFGQSSDSIQCHHGIMSAEIGQLSTLPPKERTLAAAKEYARTKRDLPREAFQGGFILEKIDGPLSKGHLALVNADVETTPNVTFNYFKHPYDLQRCVYGIRTIERVMRTKHIAELTDDYKYSTDMLLNMSVRANVNLIPKHTNDTSSLEQFCNSFLCLRYSNNKLIRVQSENSLSFGVKFEVVFVMERRIDFLESIGEDAAANVLMGLDDPADLLRASSVSNSWYQFVIRNGLIKKLCQRMCPELSIFSSVVEEISSSTDIEGGSSSDTEWEILKREHRVYSCLSHSLVLHMEQDDCILKAIGASSTDNYPDESINNTLEPGDRGQMRPSYWSSKGEIDPSVPENLTYKLKSNLCIVNEIKLHPFKAFFQFGHPIYSAKAVRFRLGYSKIAQEAASDDVLTGQQYTDDNYVWMYVSPEFPMLQENTLQSFKLPRPVICVGGIVQIELLGRVQRQEIDQLFYFSVRHIKVMGCNLSPVFNCDNLYGVISGPVLKFFPDAKACTTSEAHLQHTWQQIFGTRLRKLRWNCAIFNGFLVATQKDEFSPM